MSSDKYEDEYDEVNKKTTGTLTIATSTADDAGVYKCTADFGGTTVESETATVSVYGKTVDKHEASIFEKI